MADNTVVVIGATGLIGSQLVQKLLADPYFTKVRIIVRHWEQPTPPRLEVIKSTFTQEELDRQVGDCSAIFSCMGTTQKNVKGDQQLYHKIDVEIPVQVARVGKLHGARKFLMVSSVGADPASRNFYLRLKGLAESEITAVQLDETHIFRPSFLVGPRAENRPLEKIMTPLMQAFSFFLAGNLKKYRAIHSTNIASAMITACKQKNEGVHFYHYSDILAMSRQ